jgi:hypothetical protein
LISLNGDSTVDFKDGTFNGITSLSTSGAIFSDAASSSAAGTVIVRIDGTTFQGVFFFFLFSYFVTFFFLYCDVFMELLISFFRFRTL